MNSKIKKRTIIIEFLNYKDKDAVLNQYRHKQLWKDKLCGGASHAFFFFLKPPIKVDAPMGHPPLKSEAPPLKSKAPFQEMIPRKKKQESWKLSIV